MGSLDGSVALVTGASRGIGRSIALELARCGARVALNYCRGEAAAKEVAHEVQRIVHGAIANRAVVGLLHKTSRGAAATGGVSVLAPLGTNGDVEGRAEPKADGRCMIIKADLSKSGEARGAVDKVLGHWGRLDILVNNAGINRDRVLRKLSDDDWLAVIETDLNSVFYCTSAAVPAMIEQGYGRIVNISSVIGQSGNIGQANYAAAKGGIIAFTKSAALELAKHNITVNAVAPGFTETDMLSSVPGEIREQIKAKIPLGRFAQPHEIAKAVAYLATDGDYITGQQLNINGGIHL